VLLSGFPDSVETWNELAPSFETTYHVVRMAYPDMDQPSLRRFWGYSNREVVDALAVVVEEYRDRLGLKARIYLFGHDWGSMVVLSYAHHYPETISKLVAEDVGLVSTLSIKQAFIIMGYQLFLAWIFLISRLFCGNDELASRCMGWIFYLYPWALIGPLNKNELLPWEKIRPHQCYPYFQLIFLQPISMPRFSKTVPQLFLYGQRKKCNFHSPKYLSQLEATPGCKHIPYVTGGHWMHVTNAEQVIKDVTAFLNE